MARDSFNDTEKETIYLKQNGVCAECGKSLTGEMVVGGSSPQKAKMTFSIYDSNIHHVLPFYRGGKHKPNNWILLCINCHHEIHRAMMHEDNILFHKLHEVISNYAK